MYMYISYTHTCTYTHIHIYTGDLQLSAQIRKLLLEPMNLFVCLEFHMCVCMCVGVRAIRSVAHGHVRSFRVRLQTKQLLSLCCYCLLLRSPTLPPFSPLPFQRDLPAVVGIGNVVLYVYRYIGIYIHIHIHVHIYIVYEFIISK